jgi:hypothetical protein
MTLADGTDRLSRNVGNLTTNRPCVTSQKSKDVIYTAAEGDIKNTADVVMLPVHGL